MRRILIVLLTAGSLSSAPVAAQEGGDRWTLTAAGAWLSPAGDEITVGDMEPFAAQRQTLEVSDDATGFTLALEYRPWPAIGVELGLLLVDMDATFRSEIAGRTFVDTEAMDLESVLLGANWHLTPERRIDVAIGGFVAQTKPEDVIFFRDIGGREKQVFDDDIGFGVKVKLEVPLRPRSAWAATAGVRYLSTIMESETPGDDLSLDPLIVTAGVRYRF